MAIKTSEKSAAAEQGIDRRRFLQYASAGACLTVTSVKSVFAGPGRTALKPQPISNSVRAEAKYRPAIYSDFVYNDVSGNGEPYIPPRTFAGNSPIALSKGELNNYLYI